MLVSTEGGFYLGGVCGGVGGEMLMIIILEGVTLA